MAVATHPTINITIHTINTRPMQTIDFSATALVNIASLLIFEEDTKQTLVVT